jgi:hypothetical protein
MDFDVQTHGEAAWNSKAQYDWLVTVPEAWPKTASHRDVYTQLWRTVIALSKSGVEPNPQSNLFNVSLSEYGVPFRCLYMVRWDDFSGPAKHWTEGAWVVQKPSRGPPFRPFGRSLPVLPLWPGFALNTLFYAVIAWGGWGLWQIPGAIRRRSRRRAGRCPRCGYDRAGIAPEAPCPECGTMR